MSAKRQLDDFKDFHTMTRLYDDDRPKKQLKMTLQKNSNQISDNFLVSDKRNVQEKSYKESKPLEYHKNRNQGIQNKKTKPFYLKRTLYTISLLALMMIISFYFDLLSNYNFLSLLLGCIAYVVFQGKVLQYMFKKQMYKMQIDEYGALRAKIKYFFGQLNTNYLDQKNRKKYYHHNLTAEDKLFDKQNQEIYNNTMQYLISKSKINHIENIQKIHRKWQIILTKYQIMKKFVNSFMELHSSRAKIFINFIQKINSSFADSDYKMLEKIMKFNEPEKEEQPKTPFDNINKLFGVRKGNSIEEEKQKGFQKQSEITDFSLSEDGFSMSQNNTLVSLEFKKELMDLKKQAHNPKQNRENKNLLTWKEVINSLEYRHRINVKKQAYMKQSVLDELRLTSDEAKVQRQSNIKQIQYLRSKYQQNVKNKIQIQNQIQKLRLKIEQLSSVIVNKKRTTQNNQQICKMELDIRIKKVEIQNLQIKATLVEDLIRRNSYQLYVKCRDINKELQTRTLPQFNNKLSNYINMILQYEKRCSKYVFNLVKQSQSNIKSTNQQNQQFNLLFDPAGLLQQQNFQKIKQLLNSQSFTQIYQIFRTRQRSQQNIKTFFQEIKKFYKQTSLNFQKTVQTIETYQKQLFEKANGQAINPSGRNINFSTTKDKQNQLQSLPSLTTSYATNLFYDRYFLNILSSLSRKDQKVINQSLKIIQKQSSFFIQYFETYSKPLTVSIQSIVEKFTKMDQQMKKMEKNRSKSSNPDEFSMKLNEYQAKIQSIKQQLYAEIKKKEKLTVLTFINQLTKEMIEKHYKIYQYILVHEKKSFHFQAPTQKEEQEQNRNIKFKEYQLYVLKVQKNNFDDPLYESLSRNNQNRNETKKSKIPSYKEPLINQNLFKPSVMLQKTQLNPSNSQELISKEKHMQSKEDSLKMLNKLLGVLFEEWSNSQFFHDLIKEELEISLNFKRPGIVQPLRISHFKIEQKTKQSGFQDLVPQASEMYRCLFDVKINFKGKIAVHIASRLNFGKRTPLNIQLLIKQFRCPLRICFNPFSIAKSYVSLLERPHLSIEYDVKIGDWHINRIPFFSQLIKIFIVLKLRKKMLWPKRITLSIPLAYKNTLGIAIRERILFENEKRKQKMN